MTPDNNIKKALLSLMRNGDYPKITVSEISYEAGVNRRTFYRYFKSKEDVLSGIFEGLCDEYFDYISSREDLYFLNIAFIYFSFWITRADVLKILHLNDLLFYLQQKFNDYVSNIYTLVKGDEEGYTEEELNYVLSFSIGGFWNMLSRWLTTGCKETPGEMAGIIEKAMVVNNLWQNRK